MTSAVCIAGSSARPQRRDSRIALVSAAEGYDRWAASYDSDLNPVLALERRCVLSLLPNLMGKCIIDLACGTGRWFESLAEKGAGRIFGVDLSANMLSVAADKRPSRATLVRADISHLPFSRNHFDFAVCSFAVGHISGLEMLASECRRVLKPEAQLFITDLHPEAYDRGWRTGFRDREGAVEIETVTRSLQEFLKIFRDAGFQCARMSEFSFEKPEESIFLQAGKIQEFPSACDFPALLACCFRTYENGHYES